jgi:DNA-binding LacI/PurR family transcriptional regulator
MESLSKGVLYTMKNFSSKKNTLSKVNLPEKLAVALRKSLKDGELAEEVYLPSSRELAIKYGTSSFTVQQALRRLQDDNVIHLHSRRKGFVRTGKLEVNNKRAAIKRVAVIGIAHSEKHLVDAENMVYDNWSTQITDRMKQCLSEKGYECVSLYYGMYKSDATEAIISRIDSSEQFDGAVFVSRETSWPLAKALDKRGVAWVSIKPVPGFDGNFVSADKIQAGRIAGKYFAKAGFRRIVYLAYSPEMKDPQSSTMQKLMGLVQGFAQEGVSLDELSYVLSEEKYDFHGRKAFAEYLDKKGPPDGIFCFGDNLALGALNVCREKGYSIPGQISLVGGTGLLVTAHCTPPMTVMAEPMMAVGENAADMLREMIEGNVSRIRGRYVPSKLIIRQSLKIDNDVIKELQKEFGEQIVVDF